MGPPIRGFRFGNGEGVSKGSLLVIATQAPLVLPTGQPNFNASASLMIVASSDVAGAEAGAGVSGVDAPPPSSWAGAAPTRANPDKATSVASNLRIKMPPGTVWVQLVDVSVSA